MPQQRELLRFCTGLPQPVISWRQALPAALFITLLMLAACAGRPSAPSPTTSVAAGALTPLALTRTTLTVPTASVSAIAAASTKPFATATGTTVASRSVPTPRTTPAATAAPQVRIETVGQSVENRRIRAFVLGSGPLKLALIGGIHGGYEWNSTLLTYELLDYFIANPAQIPESVTLVIVPVANPDGLFRVTGTAGRFDVRQVAADTTAGRFNANGVDLNRNWDCDWQADGRWQQQIVSGGTAPFSEPESVALRDYLLPLRPEVVIWFHSASGGVFSAGCESPGLRSAQLADFYAVAAGYPLMESFSAYPVTGDAGDWLASQGIPSFTVELSTHQATDYAANLSGVLALLALYR